MRAVKTCPAHPVVVVVAAVVMAAVAVVAVEGDNHGWTTIKIK
jgi:hypothetical protein